MNDLICKVGQTMTHLQIAEVVGSRPDSVKRTIETLAEKGIITFTQEVGKSTGGRPATIYHVNERNSYVVVAQLSPEFTAKLVDFWQETKALSAPPVPTTFLEAMKLSVSLLEQVEQQNKQIASISEICDAAVKTKAEIGSRREATAMATASVVTRKLTKLEKILERHDCKTISELMEGTGISARVANIELETLGYLRNELVEGKKRRRLTQKGFEIAKEFPSKKFIQIGILPSCEEKVVEMILGE